MNRRIATAVFCAGMAASMLTGGCASMQWLNPFAPKVKASSEVLPAAEWRDLKRENAARLAGEGIPGSTPPPTSGSFQQLFDVVEFTFWTLPKRLYEMYVLNQTPGRFARQMEDDKSADARRTGILRLVADFDFARKDPYTRRYWQIAQGDPDALVRAAAIRALNRSRDRKAVAVYIKGLDDPSPLIRLESAKALANIPDDKAKAPLIKHMGMEYEIQGEGGRPEMALESRDIKLACADGLRNFAELAVAKALVEALRERDFEVAWQARKSLILMTGHDYRYDQEKWREYFKGTNPF